MTINVGYVENAPTLAQPGPALFHYVANMAAVEYGECPQSPSTKSLGTPYTPHCTDLRFNSIRHLLGVIAGESRMNGSQWG